MSTNGSEPQVNDLQLSVASMNGDMSVSTNDAFSRALFRMGVPVSTKRFFPSNIKGAPTRYMFRVSEEGHQSIKDVLDWTVVLFEDNAAEDIARVRPGGVVTYDPSSNLGGRIEQEIEEEQEDGLYYRDDVIYYAIPFEGLAEENFDNTQLQKIMRNVIYIGALVELLDMKVDYIREIIRENFQDKGEKIVQSNFDGLDIGREFVRDNITKRDPYVLEERDLNEGKIFLNGNEAAAIGSVMGGCNYNSWYPITPASSFGETLEKFSETYPMIVEQAENEDSCLGRAIGASWAGARSCASSSGPGISNMAEFVGYSAFTEIPVVIFDIQRVGPSTGLPTHTKQGDIRSLMHIGHDEAPRMVLTPSTMEQIYEYSRQAFDLAAQYQMPVFVMSELGLGMANFTSDRFEYPDEPPDKGKMLTDEELDELEEFNRYEDVDGDGICYRTVPGQKATYVTRGSGHAPDATLTEDPDLYSANLERIFEKLDRALESGDVPEPDYYGDGEADIGILGFGSSHYTIREAQDQLAEQGIATNFMDNACVLPLPKQELTEFFADHETVYVVEQNYSGQFMSVLKEELGHDYDLRPIRNYDGDFMKPTQLTNRISGDRS